jgi:hypothetical protein
LKERPPSPAKESIRSATHSDIAVDRQLGDNRTNDGEVSEEDLDALCGSNDGHADPLASGDESRDQDRVIVGISDTTGTAKSARPQDDESDPLALKDDVDWYHDIRGAASGIEGIDLEERGRLSSPREDVPLVSLTLQIMSRQAQEFRGEGPGDIPVDAERKASPVRAVPPKKKAPLVDHNIWESGE